MTDLISREALLKELRDWARSLDSLSENVLMAAIECTCEQIEEFPAVDAEPVRRGRWIDKPTGAYRAQQSWCSACGKRSGIGGIESNRHKPYCPNCGAYMTEEDKPHE